MDTVQTQYPVMPLKNTVLFPQQVIPIYVGRKKSLQLIDDLDPDNKYLVVVCLLYTSPSPRDPIGSRMPSSA